MLYQLLNNLTWFVSIIFGMMISQMFVGQYDFISFIIVGGIIGAGVKLMFFSSDSIETALKGFSLPQKDSQAVRDFTPSATLKSKDIPHLQDSPSLNQILTPTEQPKVSALKKQEVTKTESIADFYQEIEKEENEVKGKETVDTTPNFIEVFFKENVLAKIGGILLFLGTLFLMSLIYTYLTPAGKIILGFLIGILFYITGVILEKKGFTKEGLVLIGVGLVVNYGVILSGRYVIQNDVGELFLSSQITFFLLIINSLFSLITSLFYKSENLLLFSFVIAYLTPILIGAPATETPFGLLGYSILLTGTAYFLSTMYDENTEKKLVRYLLYTGFIGGNILAMIAPLNINEPLGFVLKIFSTAIVSLFPIFIHRNTISKSEVLNYSLIGYIFLFFNIFGFSGSTDYFQDVFSYFGFLGTLVLFTLSLVIFGRGTDTKENNFILPSILFIPFIFFFIILLTKGTFLLLVPTILVLLISYLFIFSFLGTSFSGNTGSTMFLILGAIFLIFNGAFFAKGDVYTSMFNFISTYITLGIFYFFSLYQSSKKGFSQNYLIATIGSILIAFPITEDTGTRGIISMIALGLFAVGNILLPILNQNLKEKGSSTILLGLLIGAGFIMGDSFRFISSYFDSEILVGYTYGVIAISYALSGYLYFQRNPFQFSDENTDDANVFYIYCAIAVSFISFGILNIFGRSEGITSVMWFIESTLLFYIVYLTNSKKILYFTLGLLGVSLLPFISYIDTLQKGEYLHGVNLIIIIITFILNIIFINKQKKLNEDDTTIFHIFQYLYWAILFFALAIIVPSGFENENILLGSFMLGLSIIYGIFGNSFTKSSYPLIFGFTLFFQYINLGWGSEDTYKEGLNYIATLLFSIGAYIYILLSGKKGVIFWTTVIYLVAVTTYYVGDFFDNSFAITLYWGILFFTLLTLGISQNIQKVRTFGLYILLMLLSKIIFFDIWMELDNSIARVIALMFVGGVMIYVSMLYSKRGSISLMDELSFENFFRSSEKKLEETSSLIPNISMDTPKKEKTEKNINTILKSIDISDIESITLTPNGEKKIDIKGANFFKITKMVLGDLQDAMFEPGELLDTYSQIVENYKSDLPPALYQKAQKILKNFVDKGGRVEILKKIK